MQIVQTNKMNHRNFNSTTNGELELYKDLLTKDLIKTHMFVVGAAGEMNTIEFFPDNGAFLHLFEPRRGHNFSVINSLKHFAETSDFIREGEYDPNCGQIWETHIGGNGGANHRYHQLVSKTVQERIVYNNFALGKENGTHEFYDDCIALHKRPGSRVQPYQVEIKTVDSYCQENNIEHIDFLKLDVEGWERDVLLGAKAMLPKTDFVQFEYGGTYPEVGATLKDVYNILLNWKIYNIEPGRLNLQKAPIEDFQYTNYFAINPSKVF
jgi:methyltransferase, FkbM family